MNIPVIELEEIVNSQEEVTLEEINVVLESIFDKRRVNKTIDDMLHRGIRISHEMVAAELCEGAAYAYDYMFPLLGGKRRKCGNPKMRHAYDAAWYAKQFLCDGDYISIGMLHDGGEESSSSLKELFARLLDIGEHLGAYKMGFVDILSNDYEILAKHLGDQFRGRYDEATRGRLLESIDGIREGMDESLVARYGDHIRDAVRVIGGLNFTRIARRHKIDEGYNVFKELERDLFPYFIRGIVEDAKRRFKEGDPKYDLGVNVRLFEQIDNARTLSPERPEADDTIYKIKKQMPILEEFQQWLEAQGVVNNRLTLLMYSLKLNIVESLHERKKANADFRDSAYEPIAEYFNRHKRDLMKRYEIGYNGQKFMVVMQGKK